MLCTHTEEVTEFLSWPGSYLPQIPLFPFHRDGQEIENIKILFLPSVISDNSQIAVVCYCKCKWYNVGGMDVDEKMEDVLWKKESQIQSFWI